MPNKKDGKRMKCEDLLKQAKLYNEALDIKAKRPQLIAESNRRIEQLNAEIEELESKEVNLAKSELNPKRFFFPKNKEVDINELISKKEIEIRGEENKIKNLQATKLKDVIDLDGVVDEVNDVIGAQSNEIEKRIKGVAKAREQYHEAVSEYEQTIRPILSFTRKVRSDIDTLQKDGHVPAYQGDNSYRKCKPIKGVELDRDIIQKHRKRIFSQETRRHVPEFQSWL